MKNYFNAEEFACKCKDRNCSGKPQNLQINPILVQALNRVRVELGSPIIVTSGIRCAEHNASVGGAAASKHLQGIAVDVTCNNVDKLLQLLLAENSLTGIGDGTDLKRPFIHVDVRPSKQRVAWSYK